MMFLVPIIFGDNYHDNDYNIYNDIRKPDKLLHLNLAGNILSHDIILSVDEDNKISYKEIDGIPGLDRLQFETVLLEGIVPINNYSIFNNNWIERIDYYDFTHMKICTILNRRISEVINFRKLHNVLDDHKFVPYHPIKYME